MDEQIRRFLRALWPFVTRRRFREAVQLAERLRLGRRALAADKVALANRLTELEAAAITAARTLDEAADLLDELHEANLKLTRRVTELEHNSVDGYARNVLNQAWDDVAAVSGPETRQP